MLLSATVVFLISPAALRRLNGLFLSLTSFLTREVYTVIRLNTSTHLTSQLEGEARGGLFSDSGL